MSGERSEPAGLCRLRKQVAKEKEGLLELSGKKAKVLTLREEKMGKGMGLLKRERKKALWERRR